MNLERPRPNSRIIIWDGSDNSTIRYSDYLLCEVDENLKLTILDVGTYPEEDEAQDSLNFDSKYVDTTDYSDYQHMDFDDICTGFEDEFNDWAYEDEFVLPKIEEDEDEDFDESKISAIKRFKESQNLSPIPNDFEIIETPEFLKKIKKIKYTTADVEELKEELKKRVPKARIGDLFKFEWTPKRLHLGKGETRVIYCLIVSKKKSYIMFIYKKSEASDLTPEELKRLKTLAAELKEV